MFTLFVRTVVIYLLVFAVLRLMGKRQISDLQPFDLVITLLIADVASVPISDSAIPLFYGIVPILSLFVLNRIVAFLSLRSNKVRSIVCGRPVIVISKGVVLEDAMCAANYTLGDLTEQLRAKDRFSLSEIEYGILETNGSLSVLPKTEQPKALSAVPSVTFVSDGRLEERLLNESGHDKEWLMKKLKAAGIKKISECFFAILEPDGMLHVQEKLKNRGKEPRVTYIKAVK